MKKKLIMIFVSVAVFLGMSTTYGMAESTQTYDPVGTVTNFSKDGINYYDIYADSSPANPRPDVAQSARLKRTALTKDHGTTASPLKTGQYLRQAYSDRIP